MNLADIIADLKQVRGYTKQLLDNVDDDLWFKQPAEGVNHIGWQVGHLAVVEYSLCLKRLRGAKTDDDSLLPVDDYGRMFGKGSLPSADASAYPAPAELRAALNCVHERVLQELAEVSNQQLAERTEPVHPMFQTKGDALRFCPKHEMLHAGQIALIRRFYGFPALR